MRELTEIKDRLARLETARRLESASVGAGGLRLKGGRFLAEDLSSERVAEITTDPAGIFLRQELIRDLALAIFADRIRFATVATVGILSGEQQTFQDLSTPGPTVTIDVITGTAIVFTTSEILTPGDGGGAFPNSLGVMGVAVSGASTKAASVATSQGLNNLNPDNVGVLCTRAGIFDDLTPGSNTFTAKYRAASDTQVSFSNRSIIVMAF
jgi:hypothetical protein